MRRKQAPPSKPFWKSWPFISVAVFGLVVAALFVSEETPAGPNVVVYATPT